LDYLFELAVKMKLAGLSTDWNLPHEKTEV